MFANQRRFVLPIVASAMLITGLGFSASEANAQGIVIGRGGVGFYSGPGYYGGGYGPYWGTGYGGYRGYRSGFYGGNGGFGGYGRGYYYGGRGWYGGGRGWRGGHRHRCC